jgi:hypothetical protein
MKLFKTILILWAVTFPIAFAQQNMTNRDSIRRLTDIDYKQMLEQLGITSLRPGVDGYNPDSPNAVNYNEEKATIYPNLPHPLILKSGKKVTTSKIWWDKRRPEIIKDFDEEIYGITPPNTPKVSSWITKEHRIDTLDNILVDVRKMVGIVDNSSFPSISVEIEMILKTPKNIKTPIPVIIDLSFAFNFPKQKNAYNWEAEVFSKGWGIATYYPTSVQEDHGAGLTRGIIGLMNKGEFRKPTDWGVLKAWAWGASRIMDYFEQHPAIDQHKVMVSGHSRYGKAALVALAYDARFVTAHVSSSGAAGAKLHRRNFGETVENVAASGEYHWMAGNYIKYAGPLKWDDLPVDAHELIALCAPRPVFIGSGDKGDYWVDPKGMFMAAVAAGPVYKLLGKNNLGSTAYPALETTLDSGELAFRQHSGGHTPVPNWPYFLKFAERYLK